jgi:hypothetical protein
VQRAAEVRVGGLQPDERTEQVERKLCRVFMVGGGAVGVKPVRQISTTSPALPSQSQNERD